MRSQTCQHPMAVVTRRTGLRADVIRAWERRHAAVRPARTPGRHRLYSDDDIHRLLLIRQTLEAGWQIGQVASLSNRELERRIEEASRAALPSNREKRRGDRFEPFLRRCLARVEDLDGDGLFRELEAASVALGRVQLLEGLLAPLMRRIGGDCADGRLRIAHEHLASAAVRAFLDTLRAAYPVADGAPVIVVTTPMFQHHELAAMLVAATARVEGWRTVYLGPNLPAEEIAAAVDKPGVRILALSINCTADEAALDTELRKIGRLVPDEVGIVVGGRAAAAYLGALDEIGAIRIADLGGFRDFLEKKQAG